MGIRQGLFFSFSYLVPIDLLGHLHRPAAQGQLQGRWRGLLLCLLLLLLRLCPLVVVLLRLLALARSGSCSIVRWGDAEGVEDVGPEDVHAGVVLRLFGVVDCLGR